MIERAFNINYTKLKEKLEISFLYVLLTTVSKKLKSGST